MLMFRTVFFISALTISAVGFASSGKVTLNLKAQQSYQLDGNEYQGKSMAITIDGKVQASGQTVTFSRNQNQDELKQRVQLNTDELKLTTIDADGKENIEIYPAKVKSNGNRYIVKGKDFIHSASGIVRSAISTQNVSGEVNVKSSDFICEKLSPSLLGCNFELEIVVKIK